MQFSWLFCTKFYMFFVVPLHFFYLKNPYLKMKSHQKFGKVLQICLTDLFIKGICTSMEVKCLHMYSFYLEHWPKYANIFLQSSFVILIILYSLTVESTVAIFTTIDKHVRFFQRTTSLDPVLHHLGWYFLIKNLN